MKKILLVCGLAAALLGAGPVQAKTEWEFVRDVMLDAKPIDMAIAADGSEAYILVKKAIKVYDLKSGTIVDTVPLEKKYTSIAAHPRENTILLSASDKSLTILRLSRSIELPVGSSPVIGPEDASVTLVVFLDFQCPYCSREFPVIENLLARYPEDLNVVIKHFPLRSHKFASQAAVAVLAADRQGKYRELTGILLKNFRSLNEETLLKHAAEAGLDLEQFKQDREDNSHEKQIKADRLLARKAGVRGVPSLFINGRAVKNRSLQGMAAMVEEALKKK